jgi:hypothetical protein
MLENTHWSKINVYYITEVHVSYLFEESENISVTR